MIDSQWGDMIVVDNDEEIIPRIESILEYIDDSKKREVLQSILKQAHYKKLSPKQVAMVSDLESIQKQKQEKTCAPDWNEEYWDDAHAKIDKTLIEW